MDVAVVIAFRGDRGLLEWTLEGFGEQVLAAGDSMSVYVGFDGGGGEEGERMLGKHRMVVRNFGRVGAAAVRNGLLKQARGEMVIFGNADARPAEGMVGKHVAALLRVGKAKMVLGDAPWERGGGVETVFDRLLSETPMVFFYNQLRDGEWYDWRQAWTLNLSMWREDFVRSGGFEERLRPVYFEDLALGYSVLGAEKKGILFEAGAKVLHRHPTTLEQYLDREELLGLMSPVLGKVRPEVFGALHAGKDLEEVRKEYAAWVEMDGASHRWVYERLREWAGMSGDAIGRGEEGRRILMTIYQMHVPLKRLAFRLGYLRGIELSGDERWEERKASGLWRKVIGF